MRRDEFEAQDRAGDATVVSMARRFQAGDPAAVRRVRDRVGRIISFRGYSIPAADRADLEQETMTQVWRAAQRRGFDAGHGFWGFVEKVAASRCIDWLRRSGRTVALTPGIDPADGQPGPLDKLVDRQQRRLGRSALAALGEPCSELVRLRIEGHGYREIARLLGRNEAALRAQLYRCVRRARTFLQELREKGQP